MSDYKAYTGKLKKIEFLNDNETLEELQYRAYLDFGGKGKYYKNILFEDFYDDFLIIENNLYKIMDLNETDPYDNYCIINKNEDSTFSFSTRFYNGGTCLSEMLEDTIKNQ